ncbi:MAG: ABC transporter substrate-binding protein [Thermoprotei archaeon]|nr:MAG: ABC transporter substrate-binding protein [Thermoprotei archaeon]
MYTEIYGIALRSLLISSTATLLALVWSIPFTAKLISIRHRSKDIIIGIFNTLIGLPTVLVGLVLYLLFSYSGPLGFLELLYTPYTIIIGESILITPLVISLLYEVFSRAYNEYWELALTLGADKLQAYKLIIREVISDIFVVSLISFSRAIGELGVALIVGGNIKGYTRVFTTAIALEIEKGEFETAIILGLLLFIVVLSVILTARIIKRRV